MMDAQTANNMPDRSGPGLPTTALPTDSLQGGGDKYATGAPTTSSLKLPKENIVIGKWNVRTLYACGKLQELTHELIRYSWDIIGLAEVRWTGIGEMVTDEGHKLWYSGDDSRHQHGVGFIVNKDRIQTVMSCTPISSRLITIRISARPKNLTIIQVYAPTQDYDDDAVEKFYVELEETIKKTPKKDLLIITGDWNAKIGPDAYNQWAGTVGRFGIGETNDRGIRLLEFANSYHLTLANTLFPHKTSRRTTWHAPTGKTHNQIDFILVPQKFKSSINKAQTRTFPGADIGSDHDMVLMTMKMKLKKNFKQDSPRIRFNVDKLKDPEIAEVFEARVGGRFSALGLLENDINTMTDNIKEVLQETAAEVLGKEKKKNKPWVTNDILNLCDERRELKKTKNDNSEATNMYNKVNRNIRKQMREAKEQWISDQCDHIDAGMRSGNSKAAFDTLKRMTKPHQNRSTGIEDKNGNLLTEEQAIIKRWTEYCKDLYNYKIRPDTNILDNGTNTNRETGDEPIMKEEVEEAVRSLKESKSPGVDNVPAELLKHAGPELTKVLTTICQRIWETKEWPKEWTQSLIIPLPKKGNLRLCENYRTISLISHPSKVMLRVLLNRLKGKAEEILAEEQAGFRPKRSTMEQVFNLRLLVEKHLQHQRDLYHNFIDFKKAFDRVWHEGLWQIMTNFNFDTNLIEVIKALYKDSSSAVLQNNTRGDFFHTSVGVRQGCLLSPVLFNIYLENIMRETLHDFFTSISIGGRPLCNLRFADDIDLLGGSETELQDLTTRLERAAGAHGMEISSEKSKVMVNSHNQQAATSIKLNGQELEEVDNFKYLGSTLTKDGSSTKEVKTRLSLAGSAMTRLNTIWKSKSISFPVKLKLYKSLVVAILLYGCESWTLTADLEKRIQAFEHKCFRKLLRISYTEHKTNEFVRQEVIKYAGRHEPLLATVRQRKLAWYGHVSRHGSLSKTILQGTVDGKRLRGRPRKSWLDNIKEWTNQPTSRLLRLTEDRKRWRTTAVKASTMAPQRASTPLTG